MQDREIIKDHIESCLQGFVSDPTKNRMVFLGRIDELFLLWSKLFGCSFPETCQHFGIEYDDFNSHNYGAIGNQISGASLARSRNPDDTQHKCYRYGPGE